VTTGGYLTQIREYEKMSVSPEMEHVRSDLKTLTDRYERVVSKINASGNNELTDFHARRLVEMASNIIMGYLLLADSQRDASFANSAEVFVALSVGK
jgi:hypothetical protein